MSWGTKCGYSASIEVSRKQRRAESDGIDADKLSELMQRRARGEKNALRIVWVPSVEAEDQRWLPREREALLHDLQRVRNRIESIVFTQGYRDGPMHAKGLQGWRKEPRAIKSGHRALGVVGEPIPGG